MRTDIDESVNVLGEPLQPCSFDPMTGFYRDGCCNTGPEDRGRHTVCVRVTEEFLAFSRRRGNDLTTPHPEYGFPGLTRVIAGSCTARAGASAPSAGAKPGRPGSRPRSSSPAPTARYSGPFRSTCCKPTPCPAARRCVTSPDGRISRGRARPR